MLNSKLCHTPTKIVDSFQKLYDGIQLVDGTVLKAAVADIRGDWKGLVEARLTIITLHPKITNLLEHLAIGSLYVKEFMRIMLL